MTEPRLYFNIYMKAKWSDPWTYCPDISPIKSSLAVAPAVGQATFIYRYGSGLWEDLVGMIDGSLAVSYRRYYIQIRTTQQSDRSLEERIWTGWIPAEAFKVLGDNTSNKTLDQILVAQDLSTLLSTRIEKAWVKPRGSGGTFTPQQIGDMPVYNRRYQSGGDLIGNRSATKISIGGLDETYVFGADDNIWSNWDIIEYLIVHYQDTTGPTFSLDSTPAISAALKKMTDVYDLDGYTLQQALNVLLPRNRGFIWYVYDVGSDVKIYIQTMLDTAMTLGGHTIPANDAQKTIDLWTDPVYEDVEVRQDGSLFYDRIVVRGAKIKSCFTVEFDEGSIVKGWPDSLEDEYKEAAKNTADYDTYSDYEKAEINDRYRNQEHLAGVFTRFVIPENFNWTWAHTSTTGKYRCVPVYDDNGELVGDYTDPPGSYWNTDKRVLNYLPLLEGFDYSVNPPVNWNTICAEPENRKPLVLLRDQSGRRVPADKMKPFAASVRTLQKDFGLEVKMNPAYLMGRESWSGAEPGRFDDLLGDGADYRDIMATICVELDQYIEVAEDVTTNPNIENKRTLIIDLPQAELWYIVPYTVIDVDENGLFVNFPPRNDYHLRDDRAMLRSTLASAVAYYGKQRTKLTITVNDIAAPANLADLIKDVQIADDGEPAHAGSVVTSITMNYKSRQCILQTDFFELDIRLNRSGAAGGTPKNPTLSVAARSIERNQTEITKLQTEMFRSTLRDNSAPTMPIRFGIVTEKPTHTADYMFKGNFLNEVGDEATSGAGFGLTIVAPIIEISTIEVGYKFAAVWQKGKWYAIAVFYNESSMSSSSEVSSSSSEKSSSSSGESSTSSEASSSSSEVSSGSSAESSSSSEGISSASSKESSSSSSERSSESSGEESSSSSEKSSSSSSGESSSSSSERSSSTSSSEASSSSSEGSSSSQRSSSSSEVSSESSEEVESSRSSEEQKSSSSSSGESSRSSEVSSESSAESSSSSSGGAKSSSSSSGASLTSSSERSSSSSEKSSSSSEQSSSSSSSKEPSSSSSSRESSSSSSGELSSSSSEAESSFSSEAIECAACGPGPWAGYEAFCGTGESNTLGDLYYDGGCRWHVTTGARTVTIHGSGAKWYADFGDCSIVAVRSNVCFEDVLGGIGNQGTGPYVGPH